MKEDIPFQFWLARWFGHKVVQTSKDGMLTGYEWRGHLFVTECIPVSVSPPLPRTFE